MKVHFRYIIGVMALLFASSAIGQRVQNRPLADNKRFHFGFSVGMQLQDMTLINSGANFNGEVWYGQIPSIMPGFSVGVFADLRLHQYFNLRLQPSFHFGEKKFAFWEEKTQATFSTIVRSSYIDVPLLLKYNAFRDANYKFYILAGPAIGFNLGSEKLETISLSTIDFQIQIGIGCHIYLPYFTLSPEFKVCIGLTDQLQRERAYNLDDKKYTDAITRLTQQLFILQFNFE